MDSDEFMSFVRRQNARNVRADGPKLPPRFPCGCTDAEHIRVLDRLCNYSAFNGYRRAPSDYSAVRCSLHRRTWRTKAQYVALIPDDRSRKGNP